MGVNDYQRNEENPLDLNDFESNPNLGSRLRRKILVFQPIHLPGRSQVLRISKGRFE